jgi:hypothetical protein
MERSEVQMEEQPEAQRVEQPDVQTTEQQVAEVQQVTLHHHRIHHHLITENREDAECPDDNGELMNWNSPNLL